MKQPSTLLHFFQFARLYFSRLQTSAPSHLPITTCFPAPLPTPLRLPSFPLTEFCTWQQWEPGSCVKYCPERHLRTGGVVQQTGALNASRAPPQHHAIPYSNNPPRPLPCSLNLKTAAPGKCSLAIGSRNAAGSGEQGVSSFLDSCIYFRLLPPTLGGMCAYTQR